MPRAIRISSGGGYRSAAARIPLVLLSVCAAALSASPAAADFATPFHSYATYDLAEAVALFDWNRDGALDAMVGCGPGAPGGVAAFYGNGTGGFGPRTDIFGALNTSPTQIAAADLTGDGIPDMVLLGRTQAFLGVLIGRSDGNGFESSTLYSETLPSDMAIGDLDHDGHQDIVVATEQGGFDVFRGIGDGTLALGGIYTTGPAPKYRLALGDLNADGNLDIAATTSVGVQIRMGSGTGSFGAPTALPTSGGVTDVGVAQLNGDGILDVVALAINGSSRQIVRWIGTGGGAFASPTITPVPFGPLDQFVLGDFTGDGLLDVAMSFAKRIVLYPGTPTGFGTVKFSVCPTAQEMAVGDLDQDGRLDLCVASYRHSLAVLHGNGDGTFGTDRTVALGVEAPSRVGLADMDGDGKLDFVTTLTGAIIVAKGDGAGGATSLVQTSAPQIEPRAFVLGDFDADNDVDVAVGRSQSSGNGGSVLVYSNVGGTLGSPQEYALTTPIPTRVRCLTMGDVNGDGKPDLVAGNIAGNLNDGFLSVFQNTGSGFAVQAPIFSRPAFDVAIGDVQGTSSPDICVADSAFGVLWVQVGDGTGGFSSPTSLTALARAQSVRLADYDLDGDLDIIGMSQEGGGSFGQLCVVRRTASTYAPWFTTLPGGPRDLALSTTSIAGQVVSSAYVTLYEDDIVQSLTSVNGAPYAPVYPAWGAEAPVGIARGMVDVDTNPDLVVVNESGFTLQMLMAIPPVTLPDRAPVIAAAPTANVEANGTLSLPIQAFDLDGNAISSLTATSLPSGAAFTPGGSNTQGTIAWTPTVAQVGDYNLTFTASNALTGTASTVIHVLPMDTDVAGVFLWPTRTDHAGSYNACYTAIGHPGMPSSTSCASVTVSPPGGAIASPGSLDASRDQQRTRLVSHSLAATPVIGIRGSTTVAAGQMLALSAYASTADSISASTVGFPADNAVTFRTTRSPILNAPKTVEVFPGSAITIAVTAADPDGEAISTLTADVVGLPPGNNAAFTSNGSHTSGTFTWTPTAADSGTYAVTFRGGNVLVGYAGTEIHVRAGLVAYWQLNGDGLDRSGRGVNLGPFGMANYGAGHLAQALVVSSGATDGLYAPVTPDYNLPLLTPWTIECWFRMTTPSMGTEIPIVRAGQPAPAPEQWGLVEGPDGSIQFHAQGGGITTIINSSVAAFDGAWHHVAATSDGFSVILYVDGKVRGTQSWPRGVNNVGGAITIGFDPSGPMDFDGAVDEVRIWRSQRSQDELVATMNRELTGYATAVNLEAAPPVKSALHQNQPNPFNPQTVISFDTSRSGRASLRIYEPSGRFVRALVDAGSLPAGRHRVTWDGIDALGRAMASGVYFYRLEAPGFRDARRMILLR